MTAVPPGPGPALPDPGPVRPRFRHLPLLGLAATLAVVILTLGLSAWWITLAVERPYKGWAGDEVFVEIPQGAGVASIARRLAEAGVIQRPLVFRLAAWQAGVDRTLKAGEYRFDRPMAPRRVVEKLAKGDVYVLEITFPEGLAIGEMAEIYERQGLGAAKDFAAAAREAALIADLDPAASDLEGYLFPDTYRVPRGLEASALVRQMVSRFREVFGPDERARAAALGHTVRQIVTLASLVEKETARDEERPVVAAVYWNRLRLGIGLQCDPTVIYALARAGRWTGNLTRQDLQFDSRYNTYRYAGLPPGPIAAPGRASLAAALAPADVPYLYFVSRNDGSHAFASTLSEHNANVRRFQVEYFRQQRAARAAPGAR